MRSVGLDDGQHSTTPHIDMMASACAIEHKACPKDDPLKLREAYTLWVPFQPFQEIPPPIHNFTVTAFGYESKTFAEKLFAKLQALKRSLEPGK